MFAFRGFEFPGGMGGGTFKKTYRCFPVSFMEGKDRPEVENGGKIIMPPSALDALTQRNIQYPMLFKLTNEAAVKTTHCGVLEFVADEGRIYMPYWMMSNLLVQEGGIIELENISLPTATYVKLQPQSPEFLDISNPKAVLERALRTFACLTVGDMIVINYNNKRYEMSVLELKPANAVTIIECDMNVDFDAPVGYKEPEYKKPSSEEPEQQDDEIDYSNIKIPNSFKVFSCEGNRLDGKEKKNTSKSEDSNSPHQHRRGIPNYDYKIGKITFRRNGRAKTDDNEEEDKQFVAFQGEGRNLKKAPKSRR